MTSFDRTPAPLPPEREAERIQGLLYDAITAFQFTAKLASLQHAQMRGYLAEHLATPVLAELERVRAERDRLLAVLERTQNKVADLATERDKGESVARSLEDPHESPLHHEFRLGRDLPETGDAR